MVLSVFPMSGQAAPSTWPGAGLVPTACLMQALYWGACQQVVLVVFYVSCQWAQLLSDCNQTSCRSHLRPLPVCGCYGGSYDVSLGSNTTNVGLVAPVSLVPDIAIVGLSRVVSQ